ncbi:MAG: hypothetical protein FD173_662 [Gallionellaceae bacterium]|nr:MAG: hypothetical protein FD173_662 [Gallionellaceae bacterium]
MDCDADARGGAQGQIANGKRLFNRSCQLAGKLLRLSQIAFRHEEYEFVTAHAAEYRATAYPVAEAQREFLDDLVSRQMTKRIIDLFKTVEVEPDDGERLAAIRCVGGEHHRFVQAA